MARKDFALERTRNISISIPGYNAASASKAQLGRISKRFEREREQRLREQRAQDETERRRRYEQACVELSEFDSLNQSLVKPDATSPLEEAFGDTGYEAPVLLQ